MNCTSEAAGEPSTLESLEPIRQTIRHLCARDQLTWNQSWTSVLADVNQTRRGLLLPDVFQQTLQLNHVALTTKAFQAVVEQFQLPNGAVQARKFLQWVGLSRPADHADPELAFARLPQPYRRVFKLLEREILDATWEQIRASSAKYKAEATAALSARSVPSSVLQSPPDLSLPDDFAEAKKRCCQSFHSLPPPTFVESGSSVVLIKLHSRLPLAVAAWTRSSASECAGIVLQLVDTHTQKALVETAVDAPPLTATSSPDALEHSRDVQLIGASELCARGIHATPASSRQVLIAIHLRVAPTLPAPTVDAPPSSALDYVLVYELSDGTSRLAASLSLSEPAELVTALALSLDGSSLAVSTSRRDTRVYTMPTPPTRDHDDDATAVETTASLFPPLAATFSTDAPPSAVYFLQPPAVDAPLLPSSSPTVSPPYAMAVVAGRSLSKFSLLPSDISSCSCSYHWPHLTQITSSSLDSTSQFVTLGLADGLVVVWNTLEDRIHVLLLTAPWNASVASAILYRDQVVVALSLAAQQLAFFDVANRAAPLLIRVVTPPLSSSSTSAIAADGHAAEPVRLLSLCAATSALDVPIALVEYSNGYAVLYDVRNGEAMASIRVPKQAPTSTIAAGNEAVVVAMATHSPAVFGWGDLLTTAFPSLRNALESRRLELSVGNLKRVFLASVDGTSSSSPFPSALTLSLDAKASLQALLLFTAGRSTSLGLWEPLVDSKSASTSFNTDSHSSLASTGAANAPLDCDTAPPLLMPPPTEPYKPTASALFERVCAASEAAAMASRDAKLQRRRNELLKILTAAW